MASAGICLAAAINIPSLPRTINANAGGGFSFQYTGTLTASDTITVTISGTSCLQGGGAYCTNAAGVVVVAGSSGVGQATSANLGGIFNYGSVLMNISGAGTVQLFPANAGNGLGSSSPPTTLTLPPTTLGALGFANFPVTNPTITFSMADDNFGDNGGSFTVTQTGGGGGTPSTTPAPSSWVLLVCGLVVVCLLVPRLRRQAGVN
jgi:hypothetical protein